MAFRPDEADLVDKCDAHDITCPICVKFFKDPVFVPGVCQHVFCHECLKTYVKDNGPFCPTCKEEIGTKAETTHLLTASLVQKVNVFCSNRCGWKGRLDSRAAHVASGCPKHLLDELAEDIVRVEHELQVIEKEQSELHEQRSVLEKERERLHQVQASIKEALVAGRSPHSSDLDRLQRSKFASKEIGRAALRGQMDELHAAVKKEQRRVSELQEALANERNRHRVTTVEFHRMKAELATQHRQERILTAKIAALEEAITSVAQPAAPETEAPPAQPPNLQTIEVATQSLHGPQEVSGEERQRTRQLISSWVPADHWQGISGGDESTPSFVSMIKALNLQPTSSHLPTTTLLESRNRPTPGVDARFGPGPPPGLSKPFDASSRPTTTVPGHPQYWQ